MMLIALVVGSGQEESKTIGVVMCMFIALNVNIVLRMARRTKMKKTKMTIEITFEDDINLNDHNEVVLNVASAILNKVNGSESGIAPQHTYTQQGIISNGSIAYEIDFKNNETRLSQPLWKKHYHLIKLLIDGQ